LCLPRSRAPPQRQEKPPPRLSTQHWYEAHRSKYYRWYYTAELRRQGASLRSIARQVGASPATVLRDLRRSMDWASDQHDREDLRETRERLRERRAGRP
jgi:IS30 family transposase